MSSLQKHHETLSAFFNDQSRTPAKVTALVDAAARIMAEPAKHMLKNAGLSSDTVEPFVLLDHGCGAGTVAELLQDLINGGILTRSRILCADVSEAMVGLVKERSQKWVSVEAMTLDAMNSKQPKEHFTHVTANFVMHVVPDPVAAAQDIYNILQPGGRFSFTVWTADNLGWEPDLRSSFESLPFDAPLPNPIKVALHGKDEWIDSLGVQKELYAVGFTNVQIENLETTTHIADANDFVSTFEGMIDWMVKSSWSEESKKKGRELEGGVERWIIDHLRKKHGEQGWNTVWRSLIVTCVKP